MTNVRKQYRIVGNKKGKLNINTSQLHTVVGDTTDELNGGNGDEINKVTDYRSELEVDGYIYAGYLFNDEPTITRTKDGNKEVAQNVTNLETDWTNRLTLIYQ